MSNQTLKDRLMADLKTSMKEKDQVAKSTITLIRAEIKQVEVDQRIELDEAGMIDVIARQLKQRRDALGEFERGGRDDLVEQTLNEIEIIERYLPKQLTDEEIEAIVDATLQETGVTSKKEMGKLMKVLMPKFKGVADGKRVSAVVGKKLK